LNIGIIVHSHTGNTLSVAQKLKDTFLTLLAYNEALSIEQITAIDDKQTEISKIQLKSIPKVGEYDVLIFGAPVQGLSLSRVMEAYLSQVASLDGKKVGCFVTQGFPYPWMGGNRAIEQMKKICELKGAVVYETGIVNWPRKRRNQKIAEIVEKLSKVRVE